MDDPTGDMFPALQSRRSRPMDGAVDQARRVLWRAFQYGTLNEDEFASTLERLESDSGLTDASSDWEQPNDSPSAEGTPTAIEGENSPTGSARDQQRADARRA